MSRVLKAQNGSRREGKILSPLSHSISSPSRGHRNPPAISFQDPHLGLQERTNGAGLMEFRRESRILCRLDNAIKSPRINSKAAGGLLTPCYQFISQKPHPGLYKADARAWVSVQQEGAETDFILYLCVPCPQNFQGAYHPPAVHPLLAVQ